MKKRSTEKRVRVDAGKVPPPTKADMARLEKAMKQPVDTSDIPEWTAEQFEQASKRRRERLRRIPKDVA